MRTLKFRCFDNKSNKMIENCSHVQREGIEIMQFTGLLDRHGVEIYEGDIVKTLKWGAYAIEFKELFDNEQGFSLGTGFDMHMNNGNEVEVIGNIHQNKHLL